LVIFPPHPPSLEELSRTIEKEKVSVLWLTAGLFHQMSEEHLASLAGVRQLLAGGDTLSVPHVMKAARQLPDTQIINGYGPTENTTFTCCYRVPKNWQGGNSVPIGRPISNTRVYILDRFHHPVPTGLPGELYVAGEGLAHGYASQNDLTSAKFAASPFPETEPGRLYRTGDLARWMADGNIEFLGRLDNQLKIRGFRVEPGEIENCLLKNDAIEQALVTGQKDKSGNNQLVAYVVRRPGTNPTSGNLREFLSKTLPAYMLPSRFAVLDAFPLTSNGKVDRARLPASEAVSDPTVKKAIAPRNTIEQKLGAIWSELLGSQEFGVEDNFFHLGGHSLLATQVISRIIRELDIELPVRIIFEFPTIAALAREVEEAQRLRPGSANYRISPQVKGPAAQDLLARLDELSDEEVEKLLSNPDLKQVLT
jgi:aspartate racemase